LSSAPALQDEFRSGDDPHMRKHTLALASIIAICAVTLSAQTADEIIAKYVKTIGGLDAINAVHSIKRTGKFTGGGGFEAVLGEEAKRPNMIRQEFSLQGLTGVTAYDGKNGWKIEPWEGKKDAEPLGEDELKEVIEDSDFDGPLINYQQKGNKVDFVGMEPVEGTDAYKLKVTLANGDTRFYYMDTDYYVPIKVETKRVVRGAEREFETSVGDYKQVGGVYYPYSFESGPKGSQNRQKVTWQKIEANVTVTDSRFTKPEVKK
jgi:hypothetical protein